jgi:hypothetical protein
MDGPRFGLTPKSTVDHSPPNWQDRVVVGTGGTPTHQTWRLLTAQARAEGGTAKWNPLNCTLWIQNFTELPNYNDIPVRNYRYPDAGVCAIVLTLTQRNASGTLMFGKLKNQLQHASDGRTAEQMLAAGWDDFKVWAGTSSDAYPNLIKSLLKETS